MRVAAALPAADLPEAPRGEHDDKGEREALFDGEPHATRVVSGVPGELEGPAIVELAEATVVVPPGWRVEAVPGGLSMEREG